MLAILFSVNTQYKGNPILFYLIQLNGLIIKPITLGINGAMYSQSGVTLAPDLGNTFAIVNTNGIAGIKKLIVLHKPLDNNGNLILPHIMPYRKNTIGLNINSLPELVILKPKVKSSYLLQER
ncbi:fimbria/pilus outer membrane usher protein [Proteus mirabilis]|uniref:fimbria/pilus outer membrane usher protein n=1 Tax=Proteus mirabilis TaxID=584 RepID=UPI0034DCF15C